MSNSVHAPPSSRVAFVTGVNGISGHAIVEHLIRTPKSEWSRIIITSRKPSSNYWVDPRVTFIGINFLDSQEAIVEKMNFVCKDVTHAFFTSYAHNSDLSKLPERNNPLFRNFLEAIDVACPKLQRMCLQTGGKHYGVQFQNFNMPCHEDSPRYDGPGSETIFYYKQEDDLFEIQKLSGINEALPIAQYFLICRELGQSPKWPGNMNGYHRVDDQCYAPSVADLTVWAATQNHCKDEAFDHSNGDAIVWRFFWTMFAQYYQVPMDGSEAPSDDNKPQMDLVEWAQDKSTVWESVVDKYGGNSNSFQVHGFAMMNWLFCPSTPGAPFMSTTVKARRLGWDRIDDTYEAWVSTFRSYENAGVLPSPDRVPKMGHSK
ncbi:SDR family oxidoreductase [Aspergillus ruber CBS 135680]|uniref:PRISE-like Rossmann-fold domain-containing protein n=1 Tax=Aspergillus ruber (strain CBS 135680) TaxID=1388766 RepID=A0A017SPT5_ASPRC|nr:uncharacterized protein EURHEDRAFT_512149 [Aspergillus ruber CBS 135680]EYE98821.1 hypothetical protein EURHEDRAFT_512149 [Aspergillus ruber CBS 135680]